MSSETAKPSSLGHYPTGEKWSFDESVTDVFDDMLDRSIPQYREMRGLVFDVGRAFVTPKTTILDIGCSRGEALVPFMREFGASNTYVGLDVSEPMLVAARERFASWPADIVDIRNHDLRNGLPKLRRCSLVLSVLTLMFVPINYRQYILDDIAASLDEGGALILVEKLLGTSSATDRIMVDRYHRMKRENGYTSDEVERKRLALEGVQVPVTAIANEGALMVAGFRKTECFWRWMNFAAWVAIK